MKKDRALIYVSQNLDGYSFSLSPDTRKKVQALGGRPSRALFLANEVNDDFMTYHGSFLPVVFPSLAGFRDDNAVERFDLIEFIDPVSNQVFYRWSQTEEKGVTHQPA